MRLLITISLVFFFFIGCGSNDHTNRPDNGDDSSNNQDQDEVRHLSSSRNSNGDWQEPKYDNRTKKRMDIYNNRLGGSPELNDALMRSVGRPARVKELLEAGASPNAAEINGGITVLMRASGGGVLETVKLLVKHGADVNKRAWSYRTALHWACSRYKENAEVVRFLIEKGAKVNAVARLGVTPLSLACNHTIDAEVVRLLLENGADPNKIVEGKTPLVAVISSAESWCMDGKIEVIKVLLKAGAKINKPDTRGTTAYAWAILKRHYRIAKLLKYYEKTKSTDFENDHNNDNNQQGDSE
jgi:ankyrin repeat protein